MTSLQSGGLRGVNLAHLKYAVEVADTGSISKAADALYMGQPNLSRAIKELEENLGISIFSRNSKGVAVTAQGEEFLAYARAILTQVSEMEAIYRGSAEGSIEFSISVPRVSYIAQAFVQFVQSLDKSRDFGVNYKETNAMRAIKNVVQGDYHLGIIRYQTMFESYFAMLLKEKGLSSQLIRDFQFLAVMSKDHPLSQAQDITVNDLANYIEIAHGDPYVPFVPVAEVKKAELSDAVHKRILVYERGSQFDLLTGVPGTFMWVSPIPSILLERYGLVQKQCRDSKRQYRDVLLYRNSYRFSSVDNQFLQHLYAVRDGSAGESH